MSYQQQQPSYGYGTQSSYGGVVAESSVEERSAFLTKTYFHLLGAILAFVVFEAILIVTGAAEMLLQLTAVSRFGWLVFLGGFAAVSYFADRWARSPSSQAMQYVGLGLYTLAEAILFAPMVVLAMWMSVENGGGAGSLLIQAGVMTVILFGALTGIVFITRKDFSFLRSVLMYGGLAVVAAIIGSIVFNFPLGMWFCWAMVAFAGASILYNTSNVMLHYHPNQYVAAALSLFASFALLLWYVLRIVMNNSRN